ncbi:hypothetical protein MASR2M36_11820 [Providencia sp.]
MVISYSRLLFFRVASTCAIILSYEPIYEAKLSSLSYVKKEEKQKVSKIDKDIDKHFIWGGDTK